MLGRLLVTLGGLVAVVLTAALIGPLFVDWTGFRTDFEAQASRILGKKVSVHGPVSARILPFPSVTLSDVRVGQDVDGSPIVQVERFSMDAELAPLLSGEARIFDMRIDKPRARVRLLADGRLDWMRGATPSTPTASVVLESVKITGGSIEFIDEQSGRTRRLEGLDAAMSTHSLAGPWRVDGKGRVDGEAGRFSLTTGEMDGKTPGLGLHLRLLPEAQPVEIDLDGALTVDGAKPVYRGRFAALLTNGETTKPAPRAKGAFELTNESVRVPEYRLEIGAADAPYTVTGEATLDVGARPQFLLTAEGQQIDINELGNNGSTAKTARAPQTSLERRLHALLAVVSAIPVPQVEGKATLRLPAVVSGDATFRDVQLDVRPADRGWTIDRAVAVLPGRTTIEASGRLKLAGEPSFAGNLLVASSQPAALSAWLTGGDAASLPQLSRAGFSAAVNLTPRLQRFERFELIAGDSRLTGRLEHEAAAGAPQALSLDLKGERFDLDDAKTFARLFGSSDLVGNQRVAAKLDVDRLTAGTAQANHVQLAATYADGRLDIDRLKVGDLAGAAFTLSGRPQDGALAVDFKVADATAFLDLLAANLPAHPVLATLARNGVHYADTSLTLTAGKDGRDDKTMHARVNGWSNGSRVGAELRFDAVDFERLLQGDLPGLRLDATLENADTALLFGQAGFNPLPIDLEDGGLLALTVTFADDGKPAETALSFTAEKTRFKADGGFAFGAANFGFGEGQFSLESDDLEPYLTMNGIALPQTGGGLPVKLTGTVAVSDERIAFSALEGAAGGNGLSGDVAFLRGQGAMRARGNLDIDHADLAWLAEGMFGSVVDPVSGDLPTGPPGKPLAGDADIELGLTVKSFEPGLLTAMSDVGTRLSYRSGTLELADFAGAWLGGRMSGGRMALANHDGNLVLRAGLDLRGADLGAVAWKNEGQPVATGRFDMTLSAEGTAGSLAGLRSALGGSGVFTMADLRIDHLNLDVMGPLMTAADLMETQPAAGEIGPLLETLVANGQTEAGTISLPFQIVEGVFKAQGTQIKVAHGTILPSGRYMLDGQSLNAVLDLGFESGTFAQDGAIAGARLSFDGPVSGPRLRLDPSDTVNFISMRLYERERRRVEQAQANVMEKQRLRREAALYRFRDDARQAAEREKAAALEREKAEALARAEAEAAAKAKAEAAAKTRAEAEAKARARAFSDAEARARAEAGAAAGVPGPTEGEPPSGQTITRQPLPPLGSVP